MKMSLPLPQEQEQYVQKSVVAKLGHPFKDASLYGVHFTQSDVAYIENTIKAHKAYRLINQTYTINEKADDKHKQNWDMSIDFLSLFLDDLKCPKNVLYFLGHEIGWLRLCMDKTYKKQPKTAEQFLRDRWIEQCL